jgi:hypothetical protein
MMSKFKQKILNEYIDLTDKVLQTTKIINEYNYFDMSRNIEKEVQRMIGRLKYRD